MFLRPRKFNSEPEKAFGAIRIVADKLNENGNFELNTLLGIFNRHHSAFFVTLKIKRLVGKVNRSPYLSTFQNT